MTPTPTPDEQRAARSKAAARLAQLETENEKLRAELAELKKQLPDDVWTGVAPKPPRPDDDVRYCKGGPNDDKHSH